jgi:CheY-like chemotaxis protein
MLQHLGYAVQCARNGEEAISIYRRAKEQGRPFDVVIMDLTVPAGLGGKETLRALRAIEPGVTAIVSSGYSDEPIMAAHVQYGFRGVLTKPYTIRELGDVLHQVTAQPCARVG